MGKYPFQSLLAALLLLALAFSIHDHSAAQPQLNTRLSLRLDCEVHSGQALNQIRDADSRCPTTIVQK
ncbi:MAG TPA: hypothetical protein VFW28_11195 [Micropepsaceae bacterium]|nr:hypothetical protein [Micropepsaceae bacterium]